MIRAHTYPSAISGVLYAEDFDEPLFPAVAAQSTVRVTSPEPEIINPRFSLDELRAATEQAHEDGREIERQAAALSLATTRQAMLIALTGQIAATHTQSALLVEKGLDTIARTILSLLAAALPALCATHAEHELRGVLHRILPPARQLPELHIRVHPSMREMAEEEASSMLEGSGAQVTWVNSNKLMPGDIAISWQNGAALRDTADTCEEIRKAVLALFNDDDRTPASETYDGQ